MSFGLIFAQFYGCRVTILIGATVVLSRVVGDSARMGVQMGKMLAGDRLGFSLSAEIPCQGTQGLREWWVAAVGVGASSPTPTERPTLISCPIGNHFTPSHVGCRDLY